MTTPNFIEEYEVSLPLCDEIQLFFEKNRHLAQPGHMGPTPRVDNKLKKSLDISIPEGLYGHFQGFFQQLADHVRAYITDHYFNSGAQGLGSLWFSKFSNIQWYPPGGGYYQLHCERDQLQVCDRALVWMLYLTDTPNGGTEFVHQETVTECTKGKLVIWPSDFTHLHRGIVSANHEKMIFTGWIVFSENHDKSL